MRQVLQQQRSGRTVVRAVPRPLCPPGGVLVQSAFSAISSGTERARVQLSQRSLLGKARERPDLVREVLARAQRDGIRPTVRTVQRLLGEERAVGYSCAGTVVEAGEHARGLLPGDRVACAGGTAHHAEYVAVAAHLCVRVPEGVPLRTAALTTIGAISLHAIRLADVEVGARVAVVGCGLVGQLALRLLRAAGAETFALDIDPRRIELAREAGSDHAAVIEPGVARRVWAQADGVGVDAVIVAAAARDNEPLGLAAQIARDRGTIVLVGAVPIEFPRGPLYEKELRFRVSRSYGPGRYDAEYEERGLDYPIGYVRWTERRNMEAVLRLQAQGLVSFDDLIEVVPVERATDAYARLADPDGARSRTVLVLDYRTSQATQIAGGEAPVDDGARTTLAARAAQANGGSGAPALKQGTGGAPVRVGLIGPGGFAGRVLLPALEGAGARLEVVGGGSGPSAASAARNGSFRRVAADPQAVLADPDVDAVVIATRHIDHAALVVQALGAGKHVFCEKPLALTGDELDAALTAARGARGTLLVGFNRRFSPLLREMAAFLAVPGLPMSLAYRVSAGALDDDHWTLDLAQGGGRALGEACHFVDSLSFLAGQPVVEVHASGCASATRPVQACDNLTVTLRFADSGVASLTYVSAGAARVPKERIEGFCGTRTAILDDYRALDLHIDNRHDRRRPNHQDKGHRQEVAAFLRAARTGEPAMELAEIENTTLATLAIVESLRTGRPVRLVA
ncbi:MAG TPA: bi-domain-containing oxidoreductase [Solirubrobacteraceae bacterium]|nr:bi-domain-containing oxidoreductase [Solirubrobacteraceae bacterium]